MGRRGPRRSDDLRRRRPTRNRKKTVVVFCEDEKTEPDYLKALKQVAEVREHVSIRIKGGQGQPMPLVERAIRFRGEAADVDEYWCVFDVEAPTPHPRVREAIQRATANGLHVAVSNPCFELWLLLHCGDRTAYLTTGQAKDAWAAAAATTPRLDPWCVAARADAVSRARRLAERHGADRESTPDDNPSSTVYLLVESVEQSPRA